MSDRSRLEITDRELIQSMIESNRSVVEAIQGLAGAHREAFTELANAIDALTEIVAGPSEAPQRTLDGDSVGAERDPDDVL